MGQEHFTKVVERIYNIPLITKKSEMKDTKSFLATMDHPDLNMKIVHIAGTNGKGSTCAYLSSLLRKAGYRVGVFTSPHLVDIRERFLLDNRMISEGEFLECVEEVDQLLVGAGHHPSFFEYLFFVAMQFFRKQKVDFLILETGLGGRFDATNAIDHKVLSVITQIALDHTQYLGDTIEKIAYEKAGIIKAGVPVVYLEQDETVNRVMEHKASECASHVEKVQILRKKDILIRDKCIAFYENNQYYKGEEFLLSTQALYQVDNARLALLAMEMLIKIGAIPNRSKLAEIKEALIETKWSGRMEEILPSVYLDGAHNLNGVTALLDSVKAMECTGSRILIFAVVDDKDYKNMLSKLADSALFDRIILTQVHNKRGVAVDQLADLSKHFIVGTQLQISHDFEEAIKMADHERKVADHIYIAGSLYLVGEAKAHFMKHR